MQSKLFTLCLAVSTFILVFTVNLSAQSFDNGDIYIILNDYGRVRVLSPETGGWQIDRLSLLVASGETSVYDYKKDAESIDTSRTIVAPALSDIELYVSADNSYNDPPDPPDVLEKVNVYAWNSGAYCLVKFKVINLAAESIDARIGVESIPCIDDAYGFETIDFLPESRVVVSHVAASTHIGYKVLSSELVSLKTFDWYDGYSDPDPDYYQWLNYGAYDTTFTSEGSDGVVSVMSQNTVPLAAGDSTEFWVGIAMGSDLPGMLANMTSAEEKYALIGAATSLKEVSAALPVSNSLDQNYPNPFNPATEIRFALNKTAYVSLKIYNILGEQVATLIDKELQNGVYTYEFNAENLSSGIYIYQLQTDGFLESKKMILVR